MCGVYVWCHRWPEVFSFQSHSICNNPDNTIIYVFIIPSHELTASVGICARTPSCLRSVAEHRTNSLHYQDHRRGS